MILTGVVLAGGKSSRMGKDKALLSWRNGESMLAHQHSLLADIFGRERVFISGTREGFTAFPDEREGCGPLEGVKVTLENLTRFQDEFGVVFVPVDMPLLTKEDIGTLISSIGRHDAITFEGMNLPVYIQNPRKALQEILGMERCLRGSRFSLKGLYRNLSMAQIRPESPDRLANINTPEDFHVALSTTNSPA